MDFFPRSLSAANVIVVWMSVMVPACGDPGSSPRTGADAGVTRGPGSRPGDPAPIDGGTQFTDAARPFDTGVTSPDSGSALDGSPPGSDPSSNPRHRWSILPAGSFLMGSPSDEPCRETNSSARPASSVLRETRHQVTLTHGFEMSQNEVTLRQFEAVTGYRPASSQLSCTRDDCPVAGVSWSEAAAYCNGLSAETEPSLPPCYDCRGTNEDIRCEAASGFAESGFYECPGYRLPTEAEFEYAYRAGSETAFYDDRDIERCTGEDRGLNPLAWYASNSAIDGERSPHPVGLKEPNAWGLYDMAGNVWNWCNDFDVRDLGDSPQTDPVGADRGSRRIVRGGSYYYGPNYLRAATRNAKHPSDFRSPATGIRCVRTVSGP